MMRATPPRRLSGVVCAVLVLLTLVLAGTLVMLSDTTDDVRLFHLVAQQRRSHSLTRSHNPHIRI